MVAAVLGDGVGNLPQERAIQDREAADDNGGNHAPRVAPNDFADKGGCQIAYAGTDRGTE